jgi:small subunit ribosomal protein S2
MKQLLEAGVHFGHQTRRWNPKMKRFIFGERNGIYIIDLQQTLERIEKAYHFTRDLAAEGGTIMFIGTKKQAQEPIAEGAGRSGMPFVNQRWLGGMLTNFTTIHGRVSKMNDLERQVNSADFAAVPKKEALLLRRELDKLKRNLGGIRFMERQPDAIFVIDTKKEHIAVTEANKLGIPVVAVVDTNCDPDVIDFVIPGNDDAIRSGTLMCRIISDAVKEGRYIAERRGTAKPVVASPTPEQEAEKARQQAEARNAAATQAAEREARIAASAQNVETGIPMHEGDPTQEDVAAPVSDAVEPNAGAIPARDDEAAVAEQFPGTQPGAAGDAPLGSHESGDTGVAAVGPETAGEDLPPAADVAGSGGEDAGHPKTDAAE